MKKDKYQGYWKVKDEDRFYKVYDKAYEPRWRKCVYYFIAINNLPYKDFVEETVDYLRLHCVKISESEFKKYIK